MSRPTTGTASNPSGLHLTISDTGWAKSLWGKLYGQWLCEGGIFVYDFDRFHASDILPMFAKYHITTFCAPPTMYRMMIKEDLSQYDLSSIEHATIAGEALNPEVFRQWQKLTGLKVMEGFGQSESTLMIGNLSGAPHKIGAMGKPVPGYDIDLVDANGKPVPTGENGEIVVRIDKKMPNGLATEYYRSPDKTAETWRDGLYHTGDLAWRDEDGFYCMWAGSMMSSSPPATASGPLKLRTSSWSCLTCLNAASLLHRMKCAVRSLRPVSC